MSKVEKTFIPHSCCTVASGDCFTQGRCLGSCKSVQKNDHEKRMKELERKFIQLQLTVIDLQKQITTLTK